jgi:hypothetical protein
MERGTNEMKKLICTFLATAVLCGSAFGYSLNSLAGGKGTTSGSATTLTLSAVAGKRIVIWNAWATSDRANSIVKFQDADATGSTTNYTTKGVYKVGDASIALLGYGQPVYVGATYTGVKMIVNHTTTGSVVVNYTYE